MSRPSQDERAARFAALHGGPGILALSNAWDAASAKAFELAGAPAIATTSAGVANVLGYADGEHVPFDELLFLVRRIVATVAIPVSVDLEAGFGTTPADVAENVAAVVDAGGVGVNLEDGAGSPQALVQKIAAVRTRVGTRVFVNARTDVWLRGLAAPESRFDEAIRRLRAYEAAGADGLFVPGLADAPTLARLVAAVGRPVNVLAGVGVPPVPELARLGVRRVSVGSGPMRAAFGLARRIAAELLGPGTYDAFTRDVPTHAEVNGLFRAS